MMWVKVHKSSRTVVAVCDEELLGKKFEQGIRQLEVRESFYKGEKMSRNDVVILMKREIAESSTFNIVGKESIETALEAKIIENGSWQKIKGVPFVLVI